MNEAFICLNQICDELKEPNLTRSDFEELIAKLDLNADDKITLKEMTDFVSKSIVNKQEVLMVGIYWIGWSINPYEKKNMS